MTEDMPEDVKAAGAGCGISLRLALAETEWRREASTLWSCPGIIEAMNAAFSTAILAERRRCAQIAEDAYLSKNLADRSPKLIAAAIRGDGNGEG